MVIPDSIRSRVYEKWVENPYLTAKPMCKELGLDFKYHGRYLNKMLSEFRSYHKFVRPEKPYPSHRTFQWDGIVFDEEKGLSYGWVKSKSRDGRLIFYGDYGSVHWYKNGCVLLYLQGPVQLARAKELFCRAFNWLKGKELSEYVDRPIHETFRKWVFELGAPVPPCDIRQFERSHGIRIFTDGSHPTGLHVSETDPFWLTELKDVQLLFAENLKTHLKVQEETGKLVEALRDKVEKKGLVRRFLEWLF